MINIDDLLKIVLVFSVAFAIAGIAFQLMRLISKISSTIEELRQPIKNINELSDLSLEDYKNIRSYAYSVGSILENLSSLFSAFNLIGKIKPRKGKEKRSE